MICFLFFFGERGRWWKGLFFELLNFVWWCFCLAIKRGVEQCSNIGGMTITTQRSLTFWRETCGLENGEGIEQQLKWTKCTVQVIHPFFLGESHRKHVGSLGRSSRSIDIYFL